jgi:hypothetical protein
MACLLIRARDGSRRDQDQIEDCQQRTRGITAGFCIFLVIAIWRKGIRLRPAVARASGVIAGNATPTVPNGVVVKAKIIVPNNAGLASVRLWVYSPQVTEEAASTTNSRRDRSNRTSAGRILGPNQLDRTLSRRIIESSRTTALYFLTCGDQYAERGHAPFVWTESRDAYTAAPFPDQAELVAAGFVLPKPENFDPATRGVVLMNAQRKFPGAESLIGKYMQTSTVTRDSVSASIVHRWPEERG